MFRCRVSGRGLLCAFPVSTIDCANGVGVWSACCTRKSQTSRAWHTFIRDVPAACRVHRLNRSPCHSGTERVLTPDGSRCGVCVRTEFIPTAFLSDLNPDHIRVPFAACTALDGSKWERNMHPPVETLAMTATEESWYVHRHISPACASALPGAGYGRHADAPQPRLSAANGWAAVCVLVEVVPCTAYEQVVRLRG